MLLEISSGIFSEVLSMALARMPPRIHSKIFSYFSRDASCFFSWTATKDTTRIFTSGYFKPTSWDFFSYFLQEFFQRVLQEFLLKYIQITPGTSFGIYPRTSLELLSEIPFEIVKKLCHDCLLEDQQQSKIKHSVLQNTKNDLNI